MSTYAIAWFATAIAFVVIDGIWLSQAGSRLYRPLLGEIMSPTLNVGAAVAFYLIYVSGIVFFAVSPALAKESLGVALLNGAVLGFVAYATYDLTNQATLSGWNIKVTLIDMAWGTFVTALGSAAGYYAAARFG